MTRRYVEVALPPPLARQLTYGVPAGIDGEIQPGVLALVPVARRLLTGVVLGPVPAPAPGDRLQAGDIRDLDRVIAAEALLTPEIIELCRWTAAYYLAPLGSALMAALPPGVKLSTRRQVRLLGEVAPTGDVLADRLLEALKADGPLKLTTLQSRLGVRNLEKTLRRLQSAGAVEVEPVLNAPGVKKLAAQWLRATAAAGEAELEELDRRAKRQAACLRYLLENGACAKKRLVGMGFGYPVIKGLESRGWVETFERDVERDPLADLDAGQAEVLEPTSDQQQVITRVETALAAREYFPALLHGVTGSGKTLVYIRAVEQTLAMGRGAIILVPEIALAWQMVRRFKAHFGEQVAVLHSQLSPGERYDTWRRLRRGEQRLVIGARSAVLAPVADPGLIVVDEEHDTSYKQEDIESAHPLSYNGRDLALVRGRALGAVVLLGSATPSLETYWNARNGKYNLLELPRRVDDRPLPQVELVDMRREPFQKKQRALFSRLLRLKIRQRLERGEQIVVLQNRRGFSPTVVCESCGEAVMCTSCHVSLTYHRSRGAEVAQARCHYCDFCGPVPPVCPSCSSASLRFDGIGTQRVETELLEQFPGIRVIRMDVDTTGWKGAHDQLVERFRRGEADVLLGTQMVAKGLDFPRVTLVGVISADTGMHMPDFRASERSFQLLTQVAGRSGRGEEPGEVVIQTRLPDARVLEAAARQDYAAFVGPELEERREAGFPPFGRLLVLRWRGPDEEAVAEVAREGVKGLQDTLDPETTILGPAPAPLARLRGNFRWQALVADVSTRRLHAVTAAAMPAMRRSAKRRQVELSVNIDPLTML
jgi:primosomal protein N' (replication factor Y) (superfamily II helicase)